MIPRSYYCYVVRLGVGIILFAGPRSSRIIRPKTEIGNNNLIAVRCSRVGRKRISRYVLHIRWITYFYREGEGKGE